jgi:hypothetical protein
LTRILRSKGTEKGRIYRAEETHRAVITIQLTEVGIVLAKSGTRGALAAFLLHARLLAGMWMMGFM